MFEFQYRTPWVPAELFPSGTSVVCAYGSHGDLVGFIGAIVAPYPRPLSYWQSLWHVVPRMKGTGVGGRLLERMRDLATTSDGWTGVFGTTPEGLRVYRRHGFEIQPVSRWIYSPGGAAPSTTPSALLLGEQRPSDEWDEYRFGQHPTFTYERCGSTVFRTESNSWGRVTHVVRLGTDWFGAVEGVYEAQLRQAESNGEPYILDAWEREHPGGNWSMADQNLPSVFHPPEARGNTLYAAGFPYCPSVLDKGDSDQDRPN